MSFFLPAHPKILALSLNPEIYVKCSRHWPEASFYFFDADFAHRSLTFDLLWLEGNGLEIEMLNQAADIIPSAKVIYTTTDLREHSFDRLLTFLTAAGFQLLTRWYLEGQAGHALFLRKDIHEAMMRTLSYSPSEVRPISPGVSFEFEPLLRSAMNKSGSHSMEGIDFIYMINLDERPEKFAQASSGLQLYGIDPYRFSAVNGWKLPTSIFDQIGVKFTPGSLSEAFIGSTYLEENKKEFIDRGFLRENGSAYFTINMLRGPIGIILSHLSVLKDAYDSGYETIWVMEDDVEVLADPRQIPTLLRQLDRLAPGWDIFFTDIDTKDPDGRHVPCRALAARPNVPIPPLSTFLGRFYSIGNNFYRTGMRYGAYSMILRRSGIKKILDYYRKYRIFIPYDTDYWLCPDLTMFYYNLDIVSHRPGAASDNNKPGYGAVKQ